MAAWPVGGTPPLLWPEVGEAIPSGPGVLMHKAPGIWSQSLGDTSPAPSPGQLMKLSEGRRRLTHSCPEESQVYLDLVHVAQKSPERVGRAVGGWGSLSQRRRVEGNLIHNLFTLDQRPSEIWVEFQRSAFTLSTISFPEKEKRELLSVVQSLNLNTMQIFERLSQYSTCPVARSLLQAQKVKTSI